MGRKHKIDVVKSRKLNICGPRLFNLLLANIRTMAATSEEFLKRN